MDELIKQGQWWWLLVVPIATGSLALLGSWLGSRLGKTTEHEQWLRNEKIETYSEYLETIRRVDLLLERVVGGVSKPVELMEATDELGGSRLRLISSEAVREATKSHRDRRQALTEYLEHISPATVQTPEFKSASEKLHQSRTHLAELMARDLNID
ncbi:hypothetical protein AB0323_13325 [Arthrobacter sp. NPDC080031]|uniref:hypothetical protein n=1 Tax=Arthrobacter sp. NPDC080031 TaxID=3155918 RepID=UPI0034500F4F